MEQQPQFEKRIDIGDLLKLLKEMEKVAREKLKSRDLSPEERDTYERSLRKIEGFRKRQNN